MQNHKGYIKLTILVLIILAATSIFYYFYSDKILSNLFNKESPNLDTVVYIRDKKLFKFNFLNFEETQLSKNYEFKAGTIFEDGSKIFINNTRNRVAVLDNSSKEFNPETTKIYFYNLNTLEEKILINKVDFLNAGNFSLEISPDGKKIAHSFDDTGYESKNNNNGKIIIIDENNNVLDEIQNPSNKIFRVITWSPKGDKLLYRSLEIQNGRVDYDKDSKVFFYNLKSKKSIELTSLAGPAFDLKGIAPDKYIWEDEDKIQIIKERESIDEAALKVSILKYSISQNKTSNILTDNLILGSNESNFNDFNYYTILYLGKDSERREYGYFNNYKYILLLDYENFPESIINKEENIKKKMKIYNIESKEYKDIMNFDNYNDYQISSIFTSSRLTEYWYLYKIYVTSIYWTSDHKSIIFKLDVACNQPNCERSQREKDLHGVYKVNVDGTNLQKINKEIPNNFY